MNYISLKKSPIFELLINFSHHSAGETFFSWSL
jgi:hypothetical protein